MTDAMAELALFERLSLECCVDSNGTVQYCNAQGKLHREYGPALIHTGGHRAWYQNGLLHRLDGPAIECADGFRSWHINGKPLTEAEWQQVVSSMEIV